MPNAHILASWKSITPTRRTDAGVGVDDELLPRHGARLSTGAGGPPWGRSRARAAAREPRGRLRRAFARACRPCGLGWAGAGAPAGVASTDWDWESRRAGGVTAPGGGLSVVACACRVVGCTRELEGDGRQQQHHSSLFDNYHARAPKVDR